MANRPFTPIPSLKPAPRRKKPRGNSVRADAGHIFLYVVGTEDEAFSKVGVSTRPYERMKDLQHRCRGELRMCYMAEFERADGFRVETAIHRMCREEDRRIEGEWIKYKRGELTGLIRRMAEVESASILSEVGDTGEVREDGGGSPIEGSLSGAGTIGIKRPQPVDNLPKFS